MLPQDYRKRAALTVDGFDSRIRKIAQENGYYLREVTETTWHLLERTEETKYY
jgi:hypothetical protein